MGSNDAGQSRSDDRVRDDSWAGGRRPRYWAASPRPVPTPVLRREPEPPGTVHNGAFVTYPPGSKPPEYYWDPHDPDSALPHHSPYRWELVAETVLGYGTPGVDGVVHARVFEADALDDGEAAPPPVVVLTQFKDHRGPAISQLHTAEAVAAAAQERFYPDGREMRLVFGLLHRSHQLMKPRIPLTLGEVGFAERGRRRPAARWWMRRRIRRERRDGRRALALTELTPEGVTRHVLPEQPLVDHPWEFRGASFRNDLPVEIPEQHLDAFNYLRTDPEWDRPAAIRVPALLGDTELRTWPTPQYTAGQVLGDDAGAYAAARIAAVEARTDGEFALIDAITGDPGRTIASLGPVRLEHGDAGLPPAAADPTTKQQSPTGDRDER